MVEIVKVLGNNIITLRKEIGWTQEKLAEKAGISVPFMTQIELGRKSPSLEVIEKISLALGVPYFQLFITENSTNNLNQYALHIIEKDLIQYLTENIHDFFNK